VIILDTHIWIWWVAGKTQLPPLYLNFIEAQSADGLGICAISCWEVAKLVERDRLKLSIPVSDWISVALMPPCQLVPLSPAIAIESTQLPGSFHRDPADQMIVATARHLNCTLVTMDQLILAYPHVRTIVPGVAEYGTPG
jgi:PIN domain nuclease of toxin-antitoxin system